MLASVASWLRRSWGWLLGAALAILGAGWLWERRKRLSAEAAEEVARLEREIAAKRAVRERLLGEAGDHQSTIDRLDESIAANERAIVSRHESIEGMSHEEIRDRLRALGY